MTDRASMHFSKSCPIHHPADSPGWVSTPSGWPVGITGGLSLRTGGVSTGSLSSLNLGSRCGDQGNLISENLSRLSQSTEIRLERAARIELEHKTRTIRVNRGGLAGPADGLVTGERGLPLALTVADCYPVFLASATGEIGLVHCGWRGVVSQAAISCLDALCDLSGAEPADIQVWIGPGIGPCCFEVDAVVANKFPAEAIVDGAGESNNPRIDLPLVIGRQFIGAGLRKNQITYAGICTSCREELFFSHRRDKGETGRMLAWIHSSPVK